MSDMEIIERTDGVRRVYEVTGGLSLVVEPDVDDQPRVRDIDVAGRLGFARPRKIRELIERIWPENKRPVSRPTVGRQSTGHGGAREFTVNEYWLTEAEFLKLVARSTTPVAEAILDDMIGVYMAVRRHRLAPPPEVAALPQPALSTKPAAVRKRRQRERDRAVPPRSPSRGAGATDLILRAENDDGAVVRLMRVLALLSRSHASDDPNAAPQAIAALIRAMTGSARPGAEPYPCAAALMALALSLEAQVTRGMAADHYSAGRDAPESEEGREKRFYWAQLRAGARAHAEAFLLLAERLERIQ